MLNWAIINNVPKGITNSTGAVGVELIVMSPVMTETALVLKWRRGDLERIGGSGGKCKRDSPCDSG